jgi:dolichol kinase
VHAVERSTLGEMWFPLGVAVVALAVPERAPFAYGVLVMGLSDAAAGVVGQRYGHRAFRILGAWKTYAGSTVFFATTAVLTVAAVVLVGGAPPATVVALAATLTLVEASLGGGTDNVVLPLTAAGLLTLAS